MTTLLTPAQIKPQSFESRRRHSSFTRGGCASYLRACFGARLLPQSYQYSNLSDGADRVGGQLRRDKECPFSGVTKSGRVWRKVPESDARSVLRFLFPPPTTPTPTTPPLSSSHLPLPLLPPCNRIYCPCELELSHACPRRVHGMDVSSSSVGTLLYSALVFQYCRLSACPPTNEPDWLVIRGGPFVRACVRACVHVCVRACIIYVRVCVYVYVCECQCVCGGGGGNGGAFYVSLYVSAGVYA